ncbi:MAG: trypsin-like peptidase domain-containing protein [Bacteroidetes bacterium]|nr:trypsin-like peptidase domain-containing protein [Bacteroidota bacterium]
MKKVGIAIALTLPLNAAFSLFLFNGLKSAVEDEIAVQSSPSVRLANYDYASPQVNAKPAGNFYIPEDFVQTANLVTQAVVNITVNNRGTSEPSSGGSGVIISSDGYIITNNHVIDGGGKVEVSLNNKRIYTAEVVGKDPYTDLALLKINASGLQPLRYADSDNVQVGEWVLAVGNPFNLTSTVTAGIVSAKGRNINILQGMYSIESFIQTDAVVNPGNSGGALVNMQGELVGINAAIMSETGAYEGYSFAIPSNLVKKIMRDLKEFGTAQRALLGVRIKDVDNEIAADFNLGDVEGVLVRTVDTGSSAEDAGLEKNDIIIGVNGVKTASVPELQEQIARFRPGNSVSLDIIRNGRQLRKGNVVLRGMEAEMSMKK